MLVLQDEELLQILGKSALMCIARLKNNLKNDDKSAVAMLKKNDWRENVRQPAVNLDKSHDRSERRDKNRDHELKRGPPGRRSSNARLTRDNWLRISGHDAAEVYSPEEH